MPNGHYGLLEYARIMFLNGRLNGQLNDNPPEYFDIFLSGLFALSTNAESMANRRDQLPFVAWVILNASKSGKLKLRTLEDTHTATGV